MNVSLTLPDDLVRRVRKLAAQRETTMSAIIRKHLELIAPPRLSAVEKKRRLEALEKSFETLSFGSPGRRWTREELNERPSRLSGTRSD